MPPPEESSSSSADTDNKNNSPFTTTSLDSLLQSIRDPDLLLCPPAGTLQCGESRVVDDNADDDRAVGSILFWISVKDNTTTPRLEFSCKHASQNVLRRTEKLQQKDSVVDVEETFEEHLCDPHMFDTGYSLAGATGFQIWAGTRIVLEAVAAMEPSSRLLSLISHDGNDDDDTPPSPPPRILELGAGIGVIGITLASVYGAQVLLTDLPTLVNHATYPNLQRNSVTVSEEGGTTGQTTIPPLWLAEACANYNHQKRRNSGDDDDEEPFVVLPLGSRGGWATVTSLDWRIPVQEQFSTNNNIIWKDLDYIIASDCVWLVSMLDSLLDTVAEIWEGSSGTLLLSFQRRDTTDDQSPTFTTVPRVLQAVLARGWTMECLAWRPVEDITAAAAAAANEDVDNTKEVFLFAIRPGQK